MISQSYGPMAMGHNYVRIKKKHRNWEIVDQFIQFPASLTKLLASPAGRPCPCQCAARSSWSQRTMRPSTNGGSHTTQYDSHLTAYWTYGCGYSTNEKVWFRDTQSLPTKTCDMDLELGSNWLVEVDIHPLFRRENVVFGFDHPQIPFKITGFPQDSPGAG